MATAGTILRGYLAAARNAEETHHEGVLDGLRFTIAQHPGGHDYNIEPINAGLKALAVFRDDDLYHDDEGRGVDIIPVDGDIAAAFRHAITKAHERRLVDYLRLHGVPEK